MPTFVEMDRSVTVAEQLAEESGATIGAEPGGVAPARAIATVGLVGGTSGPRWPRAGPALDAGMRTRRCAGPNEWRGRT